MFPTRYFCNDYYAPRYWPKVGAAPAPVTDTSNASFLQNMPESHIPRHHFPPSGSHVGARHHHGFSLFPVFPGMRPAGV